MTNQEAFTGVWNWFVVEENRRSSVTTELGDSCRYRCKDGRRCGVGCLIPDGLYKTAFEGTCISALLGHGGELSQWFGGADRDLLSSLQRVHDRYTASPVLSFTEHMKKELTIIANIYRLQIPVAL